MLVKAGQDNENLWKSGKLQFYFCSGKSLSKSLNLTEVAAHSVETEKTNQDLQGDKHLPLDFSPFSVSSQTIGKKCWKKKKKNNKGTSGR